ncbi:MAG: hypothetical protein DMG71_17145 [Acidobacteria bacterium]|nr:MAG: hypothetical protein DMG71_17145 [Acidobacteriota bacterium]
MKLNRLGMGTGVSRSKVIVGATLLTALAVAILWISSGIHVSGGNAVANSPVSSLFSGVDNSGSNRNLRAIYSQMPLVFEVNQGQSDGRVMFLARGAGYGLFLTPNAAVLQMQHSAISRHHSAVKAATVRMRLDGANVNSEVSGVEPLPGTSNYFIGNDPAKWHRNIPQFARVRYRSVYPGIDLVYYGRQGHLEYDFEVAPGADPRQVALSFEGAESVHLTSEGDLVLEIAGGSIRLQAPRTYQRAGTQEQQVPGQFVMLAHGRVGFKIGAYDRSRELIIDPVLTYSSFLGGTGNEGCFAITGVATAGCPGIAVDAGGSFYVAGSTASLSDFPTTSGVLQPAPSPSGGTANIFVTKFDPSGAAPLAFSTYLGGNGTDTSVGVAVDAGLNVYVAGTTTSTNFATNGTNAAFPRFC